MPQIGTSKRNGPLMTLLLGADGEWVVWTPQGYYDTSIEGDSRFLGWHLNSDFRSTRPTRLLPGQHVLRDDVQAQGPGTALADREPGSGVDPGGAPAGVASPTNVVSEKPVPRIVFTSVEGGTSLSPAGTLWAVDVPNPRLGMNILATEASKVVRRRVIADEQVLDLAPLAAPTARHSEVLAVQLVPKRRTRLVVEAVGDNGERRSEWIDMIYLPPKEGRAPERRLVVLGIGNDQSRNPSLLPPVPFADRDAERLADTLARHLVTADGKKITLDRQGDRSVLTGDKASAKSIGASLDELGRRSRPRSFARGTSWRS